MVRETRHLWVGNLPDNIREDRIRDHFKRYGRVQNVKLLPRGGGSTEGGTCAAVAFMDIKSAAKAHNGEHVLDERTLTTEYYEPAAIPSTASAGSSPAGSGYSASSGSVNSAPRYQDPRHTSVEEPTSVAAAVGCAALAGGAAAAAAGAAAGSVSTWRGTNDSGAADYCRRGNTPAYSRYSSRTASTPVPAPYATPPSTLDRTPHHRWYSNMCGGSSATGAGESSAPSTPGGAEAAPARRRRRSDSGAGSQASSRSSSSSGEPSTDSRASTPTAGGTASAHRLHPPSQWSSASGRPLAICVRNLPIRSSDSSLKDGLYHEYKKHGKVAWVKIIGANADRYAVVRFKKPSDVEKALEVSQDKLFFGCKITVAPHQGCELEDGEPAKPYETDLDEYHPKATRTLFIGNLEKEVTLQQLRDKFKHFGRIIEIDIKKQSGGAGYAFCQYASISSVVDAIRAMDGEYVGSSRVKLGFGKSLATTCVWIDGLTEQTEKQDAFYEQLEKHGGNGTAALANAELRLPADLTARYTRHDSLSRYEGAGSRSRAASYNRSSSRTPRYNALSDHYDPADYTADRRYRVYDEFGSCSPADVEALGSGAGYEESRSLQSVVVASPRRRTARHHRRRSRDSTPDEQGKMRKESRRSGGGRRSSGEARHRSRSGSRSERRRRPSDAERRRHRRRREESGGSRAGTPLCDELPEGLAPAEPRRPPLPRDRTQAMSLPLPKFAAQVLRSIPIHTPPPAPAPMAPASPPRAPSASSSSGGSAPHSPSLEERIRSLDEKYEKWSGSRAAAAEAAERGRFRHRLLEIDIKEVKPSEVVRSLLAKRSVFDEDSERLEGAAAFEKRAPSPSSSGSPRGREPRAAPRALQYPFPTHPPLPASAPLPEEPPPDAQERVPANGTPVRTVLREKMTIETVKSEFKKSFVECSEATSRTIGDSSESSSERPDGPRPNRTEHFSVNQVKLEDIKLEVKSEPGVRIRTPSTDKSHPDSVDTKCLEKTDRDRTDHDRDPRRDSDRKRQEGIVTENEKLHEREQEKVIYSETARTDLENENASCDKSHADFSEHSNKDKIALEDEQCSIDMERHIEEQLNLEKQQRLREALLDKSDKSSQEQHLNNPDSENLEKEKFDKAEKEKTQQEKLEKEQLDRERIEKENSARDKAEKECSAREKAEKERSEREKIEKERLEQAKAENERIKCQKESLEREKAEKERKERVRMEAEKLEKERHSRVKQEKEQLEKEKMERERLEHEKQKAERDIAEKEKHEKIRIEKEKALQEKLEKEKKLKEDAEKEKIEREKLEKEKNEKERLEKERVKTEKDQERLEKEKSERETDKEKHSEDKVNRHESKKDKSDKDKRKEELTEVDIFNHSSNKPRKDEKHKHDRHRKEHSEQRRESKKENETKSRDISRKSSRDESSREMQRKDSSDSTASRASHDSTKYKDVDTEVKDDAKHSSSRHKHSHEYNHKHKTEKETSPRITDAPRKNDNDKHHDKSKERESKGQEQIPKDKVESHGDKQRHYSLDSQNSLDVETKRKDRLNSSSSLPSNLGLKRRMSSQDSLESMAEESKKPKIDKVLERRDSKDCKNNEKSKTPKFNKLHFAKLLESKIKDDKKNQVKPPDDKLVDWKDIINKDQKLHNNDKSRAGKSPKSVHDEKSSTPPVDTKLESDSNQDTPFRDLDFLATLELRSSEEDEKQKALRKEMKEKKRIHQLQQIQELQMQQDAMQQGDKMKDDKRFKNEDRKKEAAREKRMSTERKSREEAKIEVKKKIRKPGNSSDTSDSDEPKKHSIFDIVDDGPTYISMYDKVKARSCKNMQKQEEEKRQEKIKAKFSQLKQSRAKREEKKRSTSWDEDSDSDQERKKFSQKHSMVSSSDDDRSVNRHQRQDNITDSENDYENIRKMEKICYYNETINDEDARNKLSRKLSRSRIMSDTSDDDSIKRSINKSLQNHVEIKKEICSDTEMPPIDYFTKKNRETKKEFNSFKREDDEGRFTKDAFIKLFNAKFDNLDDKKTIKPEISKFEALADKIIKSEAITDHIIKPTLCATVKLDNDFKINQLKSLCNDFSSEGELSSRYTGSEIRKKHKKKQKKQKPMLSEDENKSTDYSEQSPVLSGEIKHRRNSDKTRKHNNKKEKRKEKLRDSLDSEDFREDKTKSKKGKKSTSVGFENKIDSDASAIRREEKMEDIFGPLSDESDAGAKSSNVHNNFGINKLPGNIMSNDKYNFMLKDKELEESRRRKERKRKEKRFIAKEDENSLDVDAAGKAIEASLFADSVPENDNQNARTGPLENTIKSEQDIFSFTDGDDNTETSMINSELKQAADKLRKEAKEKKKKKKKNKEDRQNRKDHHHHHGKIDKVERYADESNSILDIPILVKEVEILSKSEPDIKSKEECKPAMQSPSLPRLTDSPPLVIDELPESPKSIVECPAHDILKIENDKEPITKSEEKNEELKNSTPVIKTDPEQTGDVSSSSPKPLAKPEKYIPGFGGEIDKNISDSAVKSISEFDKPKDPSVDNKLLDSSSGQNKIDEKEEKQRAVISQEETEDAVAALLGESFGQNDDAFNSCFNEVEDSSSAQVEGTSLESENILEEDAEEMRQAVQNLNASELEIKPDTPMSENDLQIDTDTEEPDDVTPENVEKPAVTSLSMTISTSTSSGTDRTNKIEPPKLPSNTVINTSASVKINSDLLKPLSLPTLTSLPKLNDIKSDQPQSDFLPIKREGFQQITSTATPVISTAWTISGNKLREPHLINVHANHSVTRDDKPPQLPANVVQLKSSISQELMLNMQQRPLINAQAGMNPSFIINQMLRPGQVTNLQPPTIKIPEPHIMYQKQSGIVISPRMVNDVRLQSPKSSPQSDTSSPRLTILSPTPQNMGLASPNSLQQRSPGQHVTVVRMQQPPLSPIQTMHLPHGNRTMVSPNTRPNSVLVQAQSTPLHINRLPVTPVLAPLSKPMHPNNILQQQKSIHTNTMTNSNAALIPTQKFMTEMRKNQEMMDNSKLIMSPSSSLQQNTVMAQNRLIMQNPANLNAIHLANNKILFNNSGTLSDKRDIANMPFKSDIGKSEPLNKSTYGQPPIIHLANINKSTSPIIHTGPKPVITVGQDQFNVNRPHISNIVHTMNSHRLLTTVPMTSVIQGDLIKPQTSSVLTMASIRPQTVLTRFETPSNIPFTSSVLSNVMMTPPLVRASGPNIYTKPIMSSITATTSSDIRKIEPVSLPQYSASSIPNREDNLSKFDEKTTQNIPPRGHIDVFKETINKLIKIPVPTVTTVPQKQSLSHTITKCETDFEELLKDNTNEIKVTKEPDRKVEVNVAVREPITSYTSNQTESIVNPKPSDDKNDSINPAVLEKHLEVQPKAESIDENKEESEGWSAKEVNIESVIKKVDDLCKNQDPVEDKPDVIHTETKPSIQSNIKPVESKERDESKPMELLADPLAEVSEFERIGTNKCRGGRSSRGRKSDKQQDRVQTRQISKPARGTPASRRGRGGRAKVDKKTKSIANAGPILPGDVYDFHDDSGDETATSHQNKNDPRPRLILTIKSPINGPANIANATATVSVGVTSKEQPQTAEKAVNEKPASTCKETGEDFLSPAPNTRKSRRLQEKDGNRNTVDEVIEDVIKNSSIQTKGSTKDGNSRRNTRQAGTKSLIVEKSGIDVRKSPRGGKRTRDRSSSETSMDSSDEKTLKKDELTPPESKIPKLSEPIITVTKPEPDSNIIMSVSPTVTATTVPATTVIATTVVATTVISTTTVVVQPILTVAPSIPPPVSTSAPIMKPPKKMISEISAKLASAFEVVPKPSLIPVKPKEPECPTAVGPERMIQDSPDCSVHPIGALPPHFEKPVETPDSVISTHIIEEVRPTAIAETLKDSALAPTIGEIGFQRRVEAMPPGGMAMSGIVDDADTRVQSPALPHRPPAMHRTADRTTPIIRACDSEASSVAVLEGCRASPARAGAVGAVGPGAVGAVGPGARAYRTPYSASLPRGAHHPPPLPAAHPALPSLPSHPAHHHLKHVAIVGPQPPHLSPQPTGATNRITHTSVPSVSPQGPILGDSIYPHFSHQHYQVYQQHFRATQHETRATASPYTRSPLEEGSEAPTPPLELRRPPSARVPPPVPRPAHSPSPADRLISVHQFAPGGRGSPPPAHGGTVVSRLPSALPPPGPPGPPHASQVPREADSLQMLLRRYPVMWQGLLALKNDGAAVQMHFVHGNHAVASHTLPRHMDGSTPPLRIAQRMRLEPVQLEAVHRKMQMESEHCMLLALPCGRDHMDVLQQSTNLTAGFITYLQRKQAAGIVNVAPPGHHQAMYTVHIFPSCDFANENLNRIAPDLLHRVADIAHLLIVIATV